MVTEKTSIMSDQPVPSMQSFHGWNKVIVLSIFCIIFTGIFMFSFYILSSPSYIAFIVYTVISIMHVAYVLYFYWLTAKIDNFILGYIEEPYNSIRSGWRRIFFTWEFNFLIAFGLLIAVTFAFREAQGLWSEKLFKIPVGEPETIFAWLHFVLDQVANVLFLGFFEVFGFQSNVMEPVFPWGSGIVYAVRLIIIAVLFLSIKRWYDTSKLIRTNIASLRGSISDIEAEERLKKLGARAVKTLIKVLESDDDRIRLHITELLGEIGDSRAIPALVKRLEDDDSLVRAEAIESLGVCDNGNFLPNIRSLIDDQDSNVREAVIMVMGAFKDPANIPVLKKALKDGNESVREKAVKSLSILIREGIGSSEDASHLLNIIRNKSGIEQLEALASVAYAIPDEVLPILEELRDTSDEDMIQITSIELLHKIRSKEIVKESPWDVEEELEVDEEKSEEQSFYSDRDIQVLIDLLESQSEDVRDAATTMLGESKDKRAIPVLINALNDPDYMVRAQAVSSLGDIGEPETAQEIVKLINDKEAEVREEVAEVLEKLEAREYIDLVLSAYLSEEDEDPRRQLFGCICEWHETKTVDIILSGLKDRDPDIREKAIGYFTLQSEKKAVPYLIELLESEHNEFRLSDIIKALQKAGDSSVAPEIEKFRSHKSEWVRRSAEYALKWFQNEKEVSDEDIDDKLLYEKLNKYPFFKDWKKGKLSKELFKENMEWFKEDFFSEEGISPAEYKWILKKELKNEFE